MKVKICEVSQQLDFLSEDKIQEVLSNTPCIIKYAYILHDKDVNEDGTLKAPHWHIMLKFNDTQDSMYICKWFGIEEQYVIKSRTGRFDSMLCYLIHANSQDKYQYSCKEVYSNFNYESVIEKYKNSLRLEHILRSIEDGTIREYNYTNYISPEDYVKYKDKIKTALEYRRDKIYDGNRNLEVIFIQGHSGAGKTTYAKYLAKQLGYSFFVSSSDNDLLDGYKGQDCIILDDLRGSIIKLTDLLKLLDNNTDSATKSRFHNKILTECKLIIITTVISLDNFYKSIFENSNEPIEQFKRRILTQIIMDKNHLRVGQYNKETQDYDFGNIIYDNPLTEILKNTPQKQMRTDTELQKFLSIKPTTTNNNVVVPF